MNARQRQSVLNALRGAKKPFSAFSRLRSDSDVSAYRRVIREALQSPFFAQKVFHPPFPAKPIQLKAFPLYQSIPLQNELHWATEYLRSFSDVLNDFTQLRVQYHRSMIRGDYAGAEIALRHLEKTSGLSLWSIKARLAYVQAAHGLDDQKQFGDQIINESAPRGVARFVTYYASVRNEPAMLPARFRADIDAALTSAGLTPGFKAYLRYHLVPDAPVAAIHLADVLRHEAAGAVANYFEAVVYVSHRVSAGEDATARDAAFQCIEELLHHIDDVRLLRIAAILSGDSEVVDPQPSAEDATADILYGSFETSAPLSRRLGTNPMPRPAASSRVGWSERSSGRRAALAATRHESHA
jgi:hypothetical protein